MTRKGFRGRWITAYYHKYNGESEQTERFHFHPWKWAISIVLKGWFIEQQDEGKTFYRSPLSIKVYNSAYKHRILYTKINTKSLFIGLFRRQVSGPNAEERFAEGYGHYTEYGDWEEIRDIERDLAA